MVSMTSWGLTRPLQLKTPDIQRAVHTKRKYKEKNAPSPTILPIGTKSAAHIHSLSPFSSPSQPSHPPYSHSLHLPSLPSPSCSPHHPPLSPPHASAFFASASCRSHL